jgi:glycosyltransferase 2 family protein
MVTSLNRRAAFLVVAAGGLCTVAWVIAADAGRVWQQAESFRWWLALPAVALTLANVLLRLLRWQYFLRRAGVRLPMRQSAGIFVAGLAMLLTPAYAGEGVKTWLVAREGKGTWPRSAGVVVAERLFDALALALVGGVAFLLAGEQAPGLAMALAGVAAVAAGVAATRGRRAGQVAIALALSLLAWTCGCLTLYAVSLGLGLAVTAPQAVGTYGAATLLGGLTLLPAGVGVVGTAMLVRLQGYGATLQQAVLAAVLVRLLTVWLTAALGVAGCWRLWRLGGRVAPVGAGGEGPAEAAHFDALAPDYAGQLSAAARERVVARKVALTVRTLREAGIGPGSRLLDAGCGQGWYVAALVAAGYRVVGIDLAPGQIAAARAATGAGAGFAAASVLALPFARGAFDAALAVNVLHHAGDRGDQDAALAEMARAVRPGGLVFVHEISTANPLYRLYMAYLFPLWKRIDLGTEVWLDPRRPPHAGGAALAALHHYTFLPDFTPAPLYRYLEPVEGWLERSRWAPFAAHFTAVYHRARGPAGVTW